MFIKGDERNTLYTSSGGNICKTTKTGNSSRLKTNKTHQTGALFPPCTLKLQKSAHAHCQHSGASSPTLPSYNKRQDIETKKTNTKHNKKPETSLSSDSRIMSPIKKQKSTVLP